MQKWRGLIKSAVNAVAGKPVRVEAVTVLAGEYTGYVQRMPPILFPRVYDCVVLVVKDKERQEGVMHYNSDVPRDYLRDFLRRAKNPQGGMVVYTQAAHSDDMHEGVMRSRRALSQALASLCGDAGLSGERVYRTTLGSGDMIYLPGKGGAAEARRGFSGGVVKADGGVWRRRYEVTEMEAGGGVPLYSARRAVGFPEDDGLAAVGRESFVRQVCVRGDESGEAVKQERDASVLNQGYVAAYEARSGGRGGRG